jgi:hypothetical protein
MRSVGVVSPLQRQQEEEAKKFKPVLGTVDELVELERLMSVGNSRQLTPLEMVKVRELSKHLSKAKNWASINKTK